MSRERGKAESKKKGVSSTWVPCSVLKGCAGCGMSGHRRDVCNSCKLRLMVEVKEKAFDKAAKKKNAALLSSERQKERKKDLERCSGEYNEKLGLLKRSVILIGFERWGDAFNTLIRAVRRVKEDREREKKWRLSREAEVKRQLQVAANVDCEQLASKLLTAQALKKFGVEEPIQKIEVLLKKLSLEDPSMLSKNSYLNAQIIELYNHLDKIMEGKRKDLKSMKEKIVSLEDTPEQEGRKLKTRKLTKTTVMCEKTKKGGKRKPNHREMHRQVMLIPAHSH